MKTLRALVSAGALTCLSLQTQAAFFDAWKVKSLAVAESTAQKADGSQIRIDPKEEVALKISLETLVGYGEAGSRQVISQKLVKGSDGPHIQIMIESEADHKCAPSDDFSFGTMGPHDARSTVLVKPGTYSLDINGETIGRVRVSETQGQFTEDKNYLTRVQAQEDQGFEKAFGKIESMSINNKDCRLEIKDSPHGFEIRYSFNEQKITQANGDVLIKKASSGTSLMIYGHVQPRCDSNSLSGWEGNFRGENSGELYLFSGEERKTSLSFTDPNGKTCSK